MRFRIERPLQMALLWGLTLFTIAGGGWGRSEAKEPASSTGGVSKELRSTPATRPPNAIVFFCDNLRYGDIEPFGSKLHRTPNLNRMAKQGRILTNFYVASGVCTPSRAALMTGSYPRRVSMHITDGRVLRPVSPIGLHPDEITIAEVLKEAGYATAILGKWHLGDQVPFLPTRQGFDYWFGLPYSDDMVHTHPQGKKLGWPPLPLMRNEQVIEAPADRNTLTRREAEEAVHFIRQNKDRPFFLYIPHNMPGSTGAPFASEEFRGRSQNGPWGDAVEELDWAAGRVLDELEAQGLAEQTLVIWTSDNGAPRRYELKEHALPLRPEGYGTSEGGQRMPCIAWWPGRVPAGTVCDELATTMDLLPTFAALAETETPSPRSPLPEGEGPGVRDRILDGYDIRPLLFGEEGAQSPYVAFYYYDGAQLQAVRSGPWKLYLPLENWERRPHPDIKPGEPALYDVARDPGETWNLAEQHPQIVRMILALAEVAREDLGDVDRPGKNQRPAGSVESPKPLAMQSTGERN